jgi:hypothetical protein
MGAVDISKVLRLSMLSTSRSYLLSFTGAFESKLEQISVHLDIWASMRVVMVVLSRYSRGRPISDFAKIHKKFRISQWAEDGGAEGVQSRAASWISLSFAWCAFDERSAGSQI